MATRNAAPSTTDPEQTPTPEPAAPPAEQTEAWSIVPVRNLWAVMRGDTELYRASTPPKAAAWVRQHHGITIVLPEGDPAA